MKHRRLRNALVSALSAALACATVYVPPDDPLTEATLGEAIETLGDSDERVELLEDGLVADVFVYEERRVSSREWRDPHDWRMTETLPREIETVRMLVGPKRDVYLPYTSIASVRARSWPLWAGVELEIIDSARDEDAGPVVIKARDERDAQQLSDAIDRLRRARQPAESPPALDSGEADAVEAPDPEAAAD